MRIISGAVPGATRLARLQVELSKKARQRLKWFDFTPDIRYTAVVIYKKVTLASKDENLRY